MSHLSHLSYVIIDGILISFFLILTVRTKSPIYLLGIPFLLFMGRAIFFDPIASKLTQYTGLNGIWAMVFFFLIVWFINIIWQRRRTRASQQPFTLFGSVQPFIGENPIILLFILWLLNIGLNSIRFIDISDMLIASFDAGSIFLGYILVRGIVANADYPDIVGFIESLCLITAVSAFLFFLHQGLNITIFEYDLNVTSFAGGIVSRNTWYFPPLIYLLFSYGLAARKWNKYIALAWILALLSYVFSYTRTYILGSLILIIVSYVIKCLRFQSLKYIGKLLIAIAGIFIGGCLSYLLLPVQTTYMVERLYQGFTPYGNGPSNLAQRWTFITDTWASIRPYHFLGIGSPGISNFPYEFWSNRHVFDSWIVKALQYWGIAGIALIILLFYSGIRLSFKYYFSGDEKIQVFGLLFTLILIAVLIEGVFGPIFMEPYRYPLGFWYFAFLYGIASKIKMKKIDISFRELSG